LDFQMLFTISVQQMENGPALTIDFALAVSS